MATIRPIERGDLPAVSALVAAELPGWRGDAASLERILVDHPCAPEELPSLVAVEGGDIIGSIGAQARPVVFDDRRLTGISVSHLVVSRRARGGAAGALLVRQLLAGGQDLTWTDSGTPGVVRIWGVFGATVDHARTANWMLVLRPAAWAARFARAVLPGNNRYTALPVQAVPLQAVGRHIAGRAFLPLPAGVSGHEASPRELCELPPQTAKSARLRVAHDPAYLAWVFAHLETLGAPVVRRLVRRDGAPIGWYAYLQKPVVGRVIHLAAAPKDSHDVFGEMLADARGRGVMALSGRLDPHLDEPVRMRFAALGLGQRPLLHARDPEIRATYGSSASLISEMELVDSEWW
jgi:hypothetical protein